MSNHIKDDKRPALGGWAPGSYHCKCHSSCGEFFIGDKRAMMCADCAYDKLPMSGEEFAIKVFSIGIIAGSIVIALINYLGHLSCTLS